MLERVQNLAIETDNDGFLVHPEAWSEDLAIQLAVADGIGPLTQAHWQVITSLRKHFFQAGALVPFRHICLENNLDPHSVLKLFNDSGCEALRIAGLPNPGEEAKTYL